MTHKEPQKKSAPPAGESSYQDPYKIGPSTYVFSFSSQYPDQRENLKTVKSVEDDNKKTNKVVGKAQ